MAKVLHFIPQGESWSILDLSPISPGRCSVFFINYFIYFWPHGVSVAACGISHWSAQTPCLWLTVSTACGFRSFGPPAQLSHAMWDLSSPTRDRTCVPCLEDRFLTTRPSGKSPSRCFESSQPCRVSCNGEAPVFWQPLSNPVLSSPRLQAPACPVEVRSPKASIQRLNQYFRFRQHSLNVKARHNPSPVRLHFIFYQNSMWFSLASSTSNVLGCKQEEWTLAHLLREGIYWTDTQCRTESTGSLGNQPRKNKPRQLRPQPKRCHGTSARRQALHGWLWTQTSHCHYPQFCRYLGCTVRSTWFQSAKCKCSWPCSWGNGRCLRSVQVLQKPLNGKRTFFSDSAPAFPVQIPTSLQPLKRALFVQQGVWQNRNKIYGIFSLLYNVV